MAKLQKQVSRKKKDKKYYKYVLTIPPEVIKEKGLKPGDDIEIIFKKKADKSKKESKKVREVKLVKK